MYFKQITVPGMGCFSYMAGCPDAGKCMVVEPTAGVLPVAGDRESCDEMRTQLYRIGYDNIFGHLAGGTMAWTGAGYGLETAGGRSSVAQKPPPSRQTVNPIHAPPAPVAWESAASMG